MRRRADANPYRRQHPDPEPRPLRVGFVTPCLYQGGAERWIYSLSRCWPTDVRTTAILCRSGAITSRREAERWGRVIEWTPPVAEARARAFGESVDIALAWGEDQLGMLAPHLKMPLVAVSHGAAYYDYSRRVAEAMIPHADELAAVSREAAHAFHLAGCNATVIPNGAEPDRCVPIDGGGAVRHRLGIPAWAPVMLYAGRISAEKRPWIARQILDRLPESWHLIMAGASAGYEIAPHPRCHVVGAYSHPGDYLDAATVFVCPSENESHCLAMNEAWLAGVPCVTTHWPVLNELTRGEPVAPITLPMHASTEEWAAAVLHAAQSDPEPFRVMAARRYTAPLMAARWAAFLRTLTSPPPVAQSPAIPNPYAIPYPYP